MSEIEKFKEFLDSKEACNEAKEWAKGKTLEEIWETCHRGDWMLWLFRRATNYNYQQLTLAKGHCANTVRHLMKDERSVKAVDAAILFGEGNLTESELSAAAADAYADAYAAYADAADACAYAAAYAADAAAYAADACAYAAACAAADAAYADAKTKNQLLTAEICRKYLPIPTI